MSRRGHWLAVLVVLSTGCHSLEQHLVYHPAPADPTPLPASDVVKDVTLTTADGVKVHTRWCKHPRATGAVLYCPGNGGNLDSRAEPARRLWESLGMSVLIFDYPGYGRSEGTPSESGCYAAADAAFRWLTQEQGIAPGQVVIYGQSLGGGVAVELASRRPHRALVLERTFASLPDVAQAQFPLLPAHLIMHNRFPSAERIRFCRRPTFIAVADADRLIPHDHGRRLREAAGGPVQMHTLRGLGHNNPLGHEFYVALRRFLESVPVASADS